LNFTLYFGSQLMISMLWLDLLYLYGLHFCSSQWSCSEFRVELMVLAFIFSLSFSCAYVQDWKVRCYRLIGGRTKSRSKAERRCLLSCCWLYLLSHHQGWSCRALLHPAELELGVPADPPAVDDDVMRAGGALSPAQFKDSHSIVSGHS
jgi:hypothetical protein